MSHSFYFSDITERSSQSQQSTVTPYRVCREINPSRTFNIPPPSPKRNSDQENEEVPVLILESFQRPPILNFGKVILGNTCIKSFDVVSPADVEQELEIVKLPKPEHGFSLPIKSLTIKGGEQISVNVTWKPTKVGGTREKIHFLTSFGEKFELIMIGSAQEKVKIVTKRRAKINRNRVVDRRVTFINTNAVLRSCRYPLITKLEVETPIHQNPIPSSDSTTHARAALIIQRTWRRYLNKKVKFYEPSHCSTIPELTSLTPDQAALIIQRSWRRYQNLKVKVAPQTHQNPIENFSLTPHYAAIKIQRSWRRYLNSKVKVDPQSHQNPAEQLSLTPHDAALKIQRVWHRYISKKLKVDNQNHERPVKKPELSPDYAAKIIQKAWRDYRSSKVECGHPISEPLVIKPELSPDHAAKIIQKAWRRFASSKNKCDDPTCESPVEIPELSPDHFAKIIQRSWRRYLSRKVKVEISISEDPVPEKSPLTPDLAASIIQKSWHRYLSKKVKVFPPSHQSPAAPVGIRTEVALKKLINYRKFCQLQTALSSLDTTTKISPESCMKAASSSTVDTIIDIILRSNRSEPSKLVVANAFSILLTMAKYDKTQHLILSHPSLINLCIEKAKVHFRVDLIANKSLTLVYLITLKSPNKDFIISDPIIIKNLMSLINLESSTFKSHKKHKITRELVFYPYWSSAKGVMYEFPDRFTALKHINYLFKGKLF